MVKIIKKLFGLGSTKKSGASFDLLKKYPEDKKSKVMKTIIRKSNEDQKRLVDEYNKTYPSAPK